MEQGSPKSVRRRCRRRHLQTTVNLLAPLTFDDFTMDRLGYVRRIASEYIDALMFLLV